MDLFGKPVDFPDFSGFESENLGSGQFKLRIPNGELLYAPRFLSQEEANIYMAELLAAGETLPEDLGAVEPANVNWKNIDWAQRPIRMFGKLIPQPRWTAWYGDEGAAYTYSGLMLTPNPWNEVLLRMRKRVELPANAQFNSVLLNLYRNGQDHMSWHADDEPELGLNPVIASLNFGAERRFLFRSQKEPTLKFELPLLHGSLLIMAGATQHHWQHSLPKQKRVQKTRINLTFRKIIQG